jgi:hypothetical protein
MKLLNKIKKIKKINPESWTVTLEFQDGFKGVSDLSNFFSNRKSGPLVSEILRGNLFEKCFIESGHLAWPNGFELCADTLRMNAEEKAKKKAA